VQLENSEIMDGLELKSCPNRSSIDNYFETYFSYLGSFACDKAKEYAEKERDLLLPTSLQVMFLYVCIGIKRSLTYALQFL